VGASVVAMYVLLVTPWARADGDLLAGSDQALFLGPTLLSNPAAWFIPGYIPTIDKLYLEALGFPADGTTTALITPETPDFGPSIKDGVDILVKAVEADYNAGTIGPDDPLTITGYSQSTVIISQAELILAAYGIQPQDLDIVLLGDAAAPTGILSSPLGIFVDDLFGWTNLNNTVTPDDLYPTAVFTEPQDFFADQSGITSLLGELYGALAHGDYSGVTEATVQAALTDGVTDGLTTYYTLPVTDLVTTLAETVLNNLGF
jgi:PE-PPE domain